MSGRSSTSSESLFEMEELLQIKTRCIELRKEKDNLRESQAESFELIRRLELHVKTLSKAHIEDTKCIKELERELSNCFQEIDYLQDQLKTRDAEGNYLAENVYNLESKLADMGNPEDEVCRLREELKRSSSERMYLLHELEHQEEEQQNSTLCIEKLEESLSSVALEYQCEIESLEVDLIAMEQSCFEAEKFEEETAQEKGRLNEFIQDFELRLEDAYMNNENLVKENTDLRAKLQVSEMNARVFCLKVEDQLQRMLENNNTLTLSVELEKDSRSACGNILGPLLSKIMVVGASYTGLKENVEDMSLQMLEYEHLVGLLKEEVKEEKLKAKEEAEDLAQEMAELRYQITGLLEEECKRRAYIEQLSVQRIAELEGQIEKVHRKSFAEKEGRKSIFAVRDIHEAS